MGIKQSIAAEEIERERKTRVCSVGWSLMVDANLVLPPSQNIRSWRVPILYKI
jgi:hypothetical protein